MARAWLGEVLVGAIVYAGGCSSSSMPPASEITGLHFAATTTLPSNPPPPVDLTVGQMPAQSIYALTLALPERPAGVYNCGLDLGIVFNLTFFDGAATAATATAEPGGCRDVKLSGSTEVRHVVDNSYWSALAEQLGVPESMLQPTLP